MAAAVLLFALVTRVRPGMPLASNQGSLWELLFLYWQSWGSEVRHQNWKGSQVPSEMLSSESFWGRNWTCVTQSLRIVGLIDSEKDKIDVDWRPFRTSSQQKVGGPHQLKGSGFRCEALFQSQIPAPCDWGLSQRSSRRDWVSIHLGESRAENQGQGWLMARDPEESQHCMGQAHPHASVYPLTK